MNVVFAISFTGTPDTSDVLAARHAVFIENRDRLNTMPPGTPLPFSTPAELKASYLTILLARANAQHVAYAAYAVSEAGMSQRFTLAQVAVINANLTARLNAGEAAAAIVADTVA